MFELKELKDIARLHLKMGDTINVSYSDYYGTHKIISAPVETDMVVNCVKIYKFENEFDMNVGYAGIMGFKE